MRQSACESSVLCMSNESRDRVQVGPENTSNLTSLCPRDGAYQSPCYVHIRACCRACGASAHAHASLFLILDFDLDAHTLALDFDLDLNALALAPRPRPRPSTLDLDAHARARVFVPLGYLGM